ncbi:glycoside hydrolase family 97 catalytic domain-containing protein [Streptomyces sp. NBC_00201]|uniref:glycoside hydrolase family 97 catalytic domain-containing protein n=1 Tax=unclassified Streptomyces TaxID=2593676 RepID=UPI00225B5883|nr:MULTISPECIES: glycoside hydrolase family 97 catalytic domain-containing protein [unclassified Streptomyces]MCX5049644.1 glycoside hydrolase family 97 catalytic domain-containing protein [Streptomyces sp. NBC_00474]MCX5055629.1 glycoside hydrolase family 97 catalytic domain-containing protein [Streptomyces sp. NBC_00452]MCX5247525.1 glycoside hydrolase family 97 catalytic domain-containing protein [Streptomyces sp. NBC_00201]MCX5286694.1 glycoside hydrolase family 97 catalytic domain-containi
MHWQRCAPRGAEVRRSGRRRDRPGRAGRGSGSSPIDLPTVIDYPTANGVGVFLHVNRIAATDPDTLFALYRSWRVAGIKLGFINDGTQAMTNQIIAWAKTAATYELLIDMQPTVVSTRTVTSAATLTVAMTSAGGHAVILTPAS